ncbi:MAG: hypothetical protein AB7P20_12270 [Rhizobiaceae bacterium]
MRKAEPNARLRKRLEDIAARLGPLPHAALHIDQSPLTAVNPPVALAGPKKQKSRTHLAECLSEGCPYKVRVALKHVREIGPPPCPKHGPMHVHLPKDHPGDPKDHPGDEGAGDAEDAFERTEDPELADA